MTPPLLALRWRAFWRRLPTGLRWPLAASVLAGVLGWSALAAVVWRRSELAAPAATVLLLDRDGRFLGETGAAVDGDFGFWPLDALPPRPVAAALAIEDRRFAHHPGVDPLAVVRALWQNLRHGERISGASTVAMQVARMQRPGARSYPRKALEALTALALTARHGRQQVLAHYLRIVPYGNRARGIAYAARRYLDKPVADLSWAETAFLTAIPQAPARMNPFAPRGRARAIARARRILAQLRRDGALSEVEHRTAVAQLARIRVPPRAQRPEAAMHAVLRLAAELADPAARAARGVGLRVDTTLDLDLQQELSRLVSDRVERWRSKGAGNAALLVVERDGYRVRAAVGSTDYFDRQASGAIDYLRVARHSGSTLKPFLYATALDGGTITPTTVLDDLARGAGGITNSDGLFLGPLLPASALAGSRNVPAAELLARLGVDRGYALLGELGLHDGSVPARRYGLGLAIGGLPVTLEQLVGAYTALAGDGRVQPLRWLEGEPAAALPPPRRVLSEDAARQVTRFLADPQARLPTFPRMGWSELPFPAAVKTGTSSRFHDAWTVAYSARYLVGVWIGHPDHRPMAGLTGYNAAAQLVHAVLEHLHPDQRDGLDDHGFPPPRGYRAVRVCALSGQRAGAACDRVSLVHLPPAQVPTDRCRVHRLVAIDRRNGLLATAATPAEAREARAFAELPPRYAAWAAAAGLPRMPRHASPLDTAGPVPSLPSMPPATVASMPPAPAAARRQRLDVTSPRHGVRLLIDPETPPAMRTLALRVTVDPPAEQVVWYVDGQPFATVTHPYAARWPLRPGAHAIEARVPFSGRRSGVVEVLVE